MMKMIMMIDILAFLSKRKMLMVLQWIALVCLYKYIQFTNKNE